MFRSSLGALLLVVTAVPAFADEGLLPLDNLPDPDPLLLEHTIKLQRDIYTSALELQYARNLDQLCKSNSTALRCEGYEPGSAQSEAYLPGSQQSIGGVPRLPAAQRGAQQGGQPGVLQGASLAPASQGPLRPVVDEIAGSADRLTAILVLPSGERRSVRRGDILPGFGRVSAIDREGVTLTNSSSSTRLGGGR